MAESRQDRHAMRLLRDILAGEGAYTGHDPVAGPNDVTGQEQEQKLNALFARAILHRGHLLPLDERHLKVWSPIPAVNSTYWSSVPMKQYLYSDAMIAERLVLVQSLRLCFSHRLTISWSIASIDSSQFMALCRDKSFLIRDCIPRLN